MEGLRKRVYDILLQIPRGKVITYGLLAELVGLGKRNARYVIMPLKKNPEPFKIPCHRVVNRFGGLAEGFEFGGFESQRKALESEGVVISDDGKVDLNKYLWRG